MTVGSLSRRYAQALFDVARRSGAAERAAGELPRLAGAIADHAELRQVLESPAIPIHKKKAIIEAVLAASGDLSPEVRRLVLMLADRDRLLLLPAVAEAFSELTMQANRIMPAEVVTAAPLGDEARAALTRALAQATGADIRMTERVDPSIIGGVVAKVGSVVFDASVTSQLERLRQKLRAEM